MTHLRAVPPVQQRPARARAGRTAVLAVLTLAPVTLAPVLVPGLTPLSSAAAAAPAPTCDGRPATVVGTGGDDVLRGTPGPDVVVGLGGDDRLVGRGGDDVLCGGAGYDVLLGGPGADRLLGGRDGFAVRFDEDWGKRVGDHLVGGPGADHLDPGRDPRAGVAGRHGGWETLDVISFAGSRRGVTVDLARGRARGQGRDTVVAAGPLQVFGTRHDDEMRGGRHGVRMVAGGGDDVLHGGRRGDELDADSSRTSMGLEPGPRIGRGGADTLLGGRGDDHLWSTRGDDLLEGGRGDDEAVWFNRATPRVDVGPGRDRVMVDDVVDWTGARVLGTSSAEGDRLHLGLAPRGAGWQQAAWDLATGALRLDGAETDAVVTGARQIFVESDLVLVVHGTDGAETLTMEGGRTSFHAGGGDDAFTGYTEKDLFDAGAGRDTYRRDYGPPRSNDCVAVEVDRREACAS